MLERYFNLHQNLLASACKKNYALFCRQRWVSAVQPPGSMERVLVVQPANCFPGRLAIVLW